MAEHIPLGDRMKAWRAAAPSFVARQRKTLGQVRHGWLHRKQVSFVFGCQRSGTKMMMRVLDRSPTTRIFHENNALAFEDFQLRADPVLRALVTANPAPAQIFKPICDSHEADHVLEHFPEATGLWIYRRADDVAASATKKWGGHQREVVEAVVRGDAARWGWRTARLSPGMVEALRGAWREDLSEHEGGLLFWWMRNRFFLELGLDRHPRMRLFRYEDLVTDPFTTFPAVFEHVGAIFEPGFLDRVHADSVRQRAPAPASEAVRALVDTLQAELDTIAARPVPAAPPPSPVLQLINTMGVGGAERYVATVSNWLAERGVDVTIAAEHGGLVDTLHPRVRFVPTELGRVRSDLPKMARRIRALAEEHRPAVILTHSLAVTWVARMARVGVPIVNVAHGWPADRYRVVGPLMHAADRVVAVSAEVRDKLVGAGLDPVRVVVVQNGVDCRRLGPRTGAERDAARAALGAGPEDLLVVTLGRLEAQKAHQHVISMAAALRGREPRLRWAIIGEGSRAEELAALAKERGVDDIVALPGVRRDVPELLGSADLYLSCSDWEGMPLSTIEGMASGLPVVATSTEGSAALLDERCAVVVPVGDVDALVGAVEGLVADPARRAAMGAAAGERARTRFSHERMASDLAAVLRLVVRTS